MDLPTKTRSPRLPEEIAERVSAALGDSRGGVALPAPLEVGELVARYGCAADPALGHARVLRVAPVATARAGDLAPLISRRYLAAALATEALILADATLAPLIPVERRVAHEAAPFALARLLHDVAAALDQPAGAAVDPRAIVAPSAVLLPGALVGPHARIEPNAVIYGGVVVGARVTVGAGSVIGRPGFGFARDAGGEVLRVPQLGGVHLGEDVELGPLCTIDAGTLSPTVIGRGAKLDAQVHVGHNAHIGAGSMVAAQSGFAGSAEIGVGVLVGGQVGVADHVRVGDGASLAAKAGVIGDVPAGAIVAGYPAVARARWLRAMARLLDAASEWRPGPRAARRRDEPE